MTPLQRIFWVAEQNGNRYAAICATRYDADVANFDMKEDGPGPEWRKEALTRYELYNHHAVPVVVTERMRRIHAREGMGAGYIEAKQKEMEELWNKGEVVK